MAKIRTFIAVDITREMRERAAALARQLQPVTGEVRWVRPDNMHLTLMFLGDVEDLEIPSMHEKLSEATADLDPFEFTLTGLGAFPSPRRPHTLWIGVGTGRQELIELHASARRSLRGFGIRWEKRRFTPHLTLGRVARTERGGGLEETIHSLADYDGGSGLVQEITIYASQLGPSGSTYHVLGRAPLGA